VLFDRITSVGKDLRQEFLGEMRDLAGITETSEQDKPYCHTEQSKQMAFWYALAGGVGDDRNELGQLMPFILDETPTRDFTEFEKWEAWFIRYDSGYSFTYESPLDESSPSLSSNTIWESTGKGYFGWAPIDCEEGDRVAVLAGGGVPYILRKTPLVAETGKIPEYSIIGDCYVHGIMHGEAFDLLDEDERQLREIVLV
jgi:hypothetical protein